MLNKIANRWKTHQQQHTARPAYLLIADIIADGINSGEFQPRDRLPPLRDLATLLAINYTTATRGYAEARRRGLIDSRPGMGSFIRGKVPSVPLNGGSSYEMTMNSPIEPGEELAQAIAAGAINLFTQKNILALLRYQDFGGLADDKAMAKVWLEKQLPPVSIDEILVTPGIHSALVGLLTLLCRHGGSVCVSDLIYPGLKAIASQLNITLQSLPCDEDGPLPRAFEHQCQTGNIRALYVNPTIQNPTTLTLPLRRREALADVALRYSIPVIEDEAYAALATQHIASFSELIPELTWYLTGMSKCFGPGLRTAFVKGPGKRNTQLLAGALRALNVMASPLTNALAAQWIQEGTADRVLQSVRAESTIRQKIAANILKEFSYRATPEGFHLWLLLPRHFNWNPAEMAVQLRDLGVSAVSSAAFCTDNNPPDAIRICLGGAWSREVCTENLHTLAHVMRNPLNFGSVIL
ncbi:PLP-dependent aminotransferase family protein (plasmid) [Klebsiella pneumoniae]|uniref:aminotransferase-like domain-containing protein n=1 Tax=Klebsiella pneumoniae TaxID=573 RepID=UPI001110B1AA|nr:PLP-dependent aminotransferase family protein [Klebsiella pneumoniae]MCE0374713.1 PLP-dependent aminotransferase family protein [Klebsiella pneumoniae]MCM6486458.1 PLP-dependent aminotransferase family protein [Klebsiella pneumoniae]MDY2048590.1 PLP-dependent aminotransferase family protein [Klebsiella pneumoniae]TMX94536.1 PLP-dependent aminotransferase family protein [Klebsiella pneumoniae]UHL76345.1 PLP-dependent aminotransferase family protein [Klebsiella pneumoniae]